MVQKDQIFEKKQVEIFCQAIQTKIKTWQDNFKSVQSSKDAREKHLQEQIADLK